MYFCEFSSATSAQLPENAELPELFPVTLPNEGSGTEPVLEQSEEHDKEQLSSSFVPAAPC